MNAEPTLETAPRAERFPENREIAASPLTAPPPIDAPAKPERLMSLDAYRGFVMLLMISAGLNIADVAKHFPESGIWQFLGYETDHAPWRGCTLWDLIQPSFMFMVGAALPFSLAARRARGESLGKPFADLFWPLAGVVVGWAIVVNVSHFFFSNPLYALPFWVALIIGAEWLKRNSPFVSHALWRSAALIVLAVFLSSWPSDGRTAFIFTNVLAQIGLGYSFVWLLAWTKPRTQLAAAGAILLLSWLMFALYPLPPAGFDYRSVGVGPDVPLFTGFEAHWQKGANIAAAFDHWFLNLFPRSKPFLFNAGGYQTLNFIPALATMIFGLYAGGFLKSNAAPREKLQKMLIFGVAGLVIGFLWDASGLCPLVKRIWTPSFAIFSVGWAFLLLAFFYGLIEMKGWRRWAFPLQVAGMNSIALYCMAQLLQPWIRERLKLYLGQGWLDGFHVYAPMVQMAAVLLILWLIAFWMYRRKVFLRL